MLGIGESLVGVRKASARERSEPKIIQATMLGIVVTLALDK